MSLGGGQGSPRAMEPMMMTMLTTKKMVICHSSVYRCVHNVPLLVPILCQMDPVTNAPIQYVEIILILSSHLIRNLHSGILHSAFLTNSCMHFFTPYTCYMLARLILFYLIIRPVLFFTFWNLQYTIIAK
jgi:hypothetical protein